MFCVASAIEQHWREKNGLQPKASGGQVIHLGLPATRDSYNAEHGSYWNSSSINCVGRVDRFDGQFEVLREKFREQRSLNIARDSILVEKLEQDNEQAVQPECKQRKSYGS